MASRPFASLRHRDFRLFVSGYAVSLVGSWMQTTALAWVVYEMTHSPPLMAWVTFASQIPNLFLAAAAGTLADRFDRRRLVVATQTAALIQAALLAILALSGTLRYEHVLVLAAAAGIVNAFDMPARQSLMIELAGLEDLPNALALNSIVFNIARIAGPAAAGSLLHRMGAGNLFLANAASFVFVIGALLLTRRENAPSRPPREPGGGGMGPAVRLILRERALRDTLLYVGLVSLLAYPYMVLLPAVVAEELGHGPDGFGKLLSCAGAGALTGAGMVAAGRLGGRLERTIPLAGMGFGLALTALSFSRRFDWSAAILIPAGACMMTHSLCSNTLLQRLAPEAMRGRIIGVYTMMLLGVYPVGGLLMGHLAGPGGLGLLGSIRLGGALSVLGGAFYLWGHPGIVESSKRLRPGGPE